MANELQNGEHTDEWPEADRPLNGDDSDAAVRIDEQSAAENVGSPSRPEEPFSDDAADAADPADTDDTNEAADTSDAVDAARMADTDGLDPSAGRDVSGDNVDIHNGGARDIDANTVSITQGGARDIDATTVTINQGGAARIRADELNVSQGGVGLARTERLTLQEGGTAFAVIADSATLDPDTSVFLLIAGSAKGDVRPVMDWRGAAAFGASFALVLGLLRRARR